MGLVLLPVLFCIYIASCSQEKQDNFSSQVRTILKDTINLFEAFEGKFNENPKVGFPYHSAKFDLEGTEDNRVVIFVEQKGLYSASVVNPDKSDSLATDKLLYVWMKKLTDVLGPTFSFNPVSHPPGFKAYYIKRYGASKGNLSVFISHNRPDPDDSTNNEIKIIFDFDVRN